MKKKIIITVAILATLVIIAQVLIVLVKKGKINPVSIAIEEVDIHVKKDSLDMEFDLAIENARYLIFQPQILRYTVKMDTIIIAKGEKIFEGEEEQDLDSNLTLPITIYLDKTRGYLKEANNEESTDSTALKIYFEMTFDIFGIGLQQVPISITRTIRTPKPPSFKMEDVEMVNLSLNDLKLRMKGKIINENAWSIRLIDTKAHIDIKGLITGDLTMQDTIEIKAKSSSDFTAMVDVDDLQLVRDGLKAIFKVKDFPYEVIGQTHMALDTTGEPIQVNIYNSGAMPIQPLRMRK